MSPHPGRFPSPAGASRAGRFPWVPVVLAAILVCAGCGGPPAPGCGTAPPVRFVASVDSVGLDLFLALPESEQDVRRRHAASLLDQAGRTPLLPRKLQYLVDACSLAPDDPAAWLALAEDLRWLGEDLQTEAALDGATAALRAAAGSGGGAGGTRDVRRLSVRIALLRAWFHYDRAEWREGLSWVRTAMAAEPGNAAARQILGLCEASLGNRSRAREVAGDIGRADPFSTDTSWILATVERGQGLVRGAFNFLLELRPAGEHVSECWRDMGLTAELLGEWSYAGRWYRESAAALPLGDRSCVQVRSFPPLGSSGATELPVWLGMGRTFLTGSRSSYTALALERFDQAPDPAEREYWAGAAVNAAGICVRLGLDRPWALRAKGLVFAGTGMEDRAIGDLARASEELAALRATDPRVERELGRLYLLRENFDEARRHLRTAVALDPDDPRSWSDLGLVQIKTGESSAAAGSLTRAIELDPGLATAYYNRGLLNLHTGKLAEAEADLREAARLAPENQDVARLLQRVILARKRQEG
ncbi:MAG: tetratricopeptide repeat protein [bacterium]